jgi:hypothetical protein
MTGASPAAAGRPAGLVHRAERRRARELGRPRQRHRRHRGRVEAHAPAAHPAHRVEARERQRAVPARDALEEARALGAEVEHRVVVRVHRPPPGRAAARARRGRRGARRRASPSRSAACARRSPARPGRADHAPVGRAQRRVGRRDDEHVGARHEVDRVRREVPVQRREHAGARAGRRSRTGAATGRTRRRARGSAHAGVELVGEQPRHAAHPRVARLAHDHVEAAVGAGEERLRVVDDEVRARVVEDAPVGRVELRASRGSCSARCRWC